MFYPGDVIAFKDKGTFISKAIRLITGNKYTHVLVVLNNIYYAEIDNGMLSDVDLLGCRLYNETDYDVFRNNKFIFKGEDLQKNAQQGRYSRYDKKAILDALINHFLGRMFYGYRYKPYFTNKHRFICSTYVSYILSSHPLYKFDPCAEPDDFTQGDWQQVHV